MTTKLQAQTRYTLSFPNTNGHLIEIDARFEPTTASVETIHLPVWTPGSYLIREYAKNIETLSAQDDAGKPLPVERTTKATWLVTNGGKAYHIKYRTYANELAVRNAYVDATHAFFTPAAILVYNPSLSDKEHAIEIKLPQWWKTISTPLPKTAANTFTAKDLDELMDSPFEIGTHAEQTFMMEGITYRLATYPATTTFSDVQISDIKDIISQANRVFGTEAPPVKDYLFISHITGGGGGLEHKFSCVIQGSPAVLKEAKAYQGFLSLIAHEYFHLWNVKRIRPRRLGPFDYQNENYTKTLWFAEGITSYYDDLITKRAGKMTQDEYLTILSNNINSAGSQPGNKLHSLEEASFEAWIKFYRPNENSPNATVSYYTQGGVLGWAMDMHIRATTEGAKSLDDLMQTLWQMAKNDKVFYADRDAIAEALNMVCGSNQAAWLEGLVAKPAFPEIEKLALEAGLLPVDKRKERFWSTLGIGQQKVGDKIVASYIARNSPAEKAGVHVGDVLISLNSNSISEPYKEDELAFVASQTVPLEVLRQGVSKSFTLVVEPSTRMRWQIGMPGSTPPLLTTWLIKH